MTLEIQNLAFSAMLRALYITHPEPEKVQKVYNQLLGQYLASPFCMASPENAAALRAMSEILLRPEQPPLD